MIWLPHASRRCRWTFANDQQDPLETQRPESDEQLNSWIGKTCWSASDNPGNCPARLNLERANTEDGAHSDSHAQ